MTAPTPIHEVVARLRRWSYAHSGYHREVSKDIDRLIERFGESGVGTIRVVTGPGKSLPSAASSGAIVVRGPGETTEDLATGSVYVDLIGGRHADSLIESWPARALASDALAAERDRADRAEARLREARKAMDGNQTVDGVTDRGWLTPDEWLLDKVAEALGKEGTAA